MNEDIQKILNKFDVILKNYELDKAFGQMSVDSICHLFPSEILTIKNYIETYENMRKEAIKELSKEYKNLPDIDEWYATDKQWHNYYFEKSEQDDYKIENTLNILNKVGDNNDKS